VLDTADPFPLVPYCPPPFVYNSKRVGRPIDLSESETTRTRITVRSISGHQQRDDEAARWVRAEMIKRVARGFEVEQDLACISMVSYDVACRRSAVVNEIEYWRFR
jgi:hypothetical protein